MRPLPERRLPDFHELDLKVTAHSTISPGGNVYSVHSRLIGERVKVRMYADEIVIRYAQREVDRFPRLRGKGKHRINYRHVIDWLARKPGAFENYRYRDDLYPSSHFRMAYDHLKAHLGAKGVKEYLQILLLAAKESESLVEDAIRSLIRQGKEMSSQVIKEMVKNGQEPVGVPPVNISEIDLGQYDQLLDGQTQGGVISKEEEVA